MNKKLLYLFLIGCAILACLVGGYLFINRGLSGSAKLDSVFNKGMTQDKATDTDTYVQPPAPTPPNAQYKEPGVDGSSNAPTTNTTQSVIKPKQVDFVSEAQAQSFATNGKTILFFKASWCPTCKEAQLDLDKNIGKLPPSTTIVTVDYDTTKELQKKYGVTYQHTWVQIDNTGKKLALWNGGGVDNILTEIK